MKRIIFILTFAILFTSSCTNNWSNNLQSTGVILPINNISLTWNIDQIWFTYWTWILTWTWVNIWSWGLWWPWYINWTWGLWEKWTINCVWCIWWLWTINWTWVLWWPWVINYAWSTEESGQIKVPGSEKYVLEEDLKIEDKIWILLSEKDTIQQLQKTKESAYLEELPRILTYHKSDPFYDYYIFNSIKTWSIKECDKITIEDKKSMCKELFNEYKDEKSVIITFIKYGDDEKSAKWMYDVFMNLKNNNKECNTDGILFYLSCKKMFDKKFDVEKTMINYYRFVVSNHYYWEKYYQEISHYWWMDKWFSNLVNSFFKGDKPKQ